MRQDGLRFGPLGPATLHLCIDMQNLFTHGTAWHTPWLERVLPVVARIATARPDQTLFTRFIPPERPGTGAGRWKDYWIRWEEITLSRLPAGATELLPPLAALVPPAAVLDKPFYSPWHGTDLAERLRRRGIDTLVITGAETDVCVLGAVLGAVDRGYRVVLPTDALCSGSDRTHDALLTLYRERYGMQVETATTEEVLDAWR
jgi:nicotinamidase-related amidase